MARGSWAVMSSRPVTRRAATSMIATWFSDDSATYAFSLLANATPTGSSKRVAPLAEPMSCTVATTWRYVRLSTSVSITLSESETWFATQTSFPSGRTASPTGSTPTRMRAVTIRLAASITSTVAAGVFATKT